MLPQTSQPETEFWDFLRSQGGEWMWDHINLPYGLLPVVDSIASGNAVLVTDGSYNRVARPDIDGAGWLVYCREQRRVILTDSMFEISRNAGSYRGELLGLLAIHVFIVGVCEFFRIDSGDLGLVACDNLGGLNKAKLRRKKIRAGTKHADILRSLRSIHRKLRGRLRYEHVYGHQDKKKRWSDMTLLEQLNCRCDALAKAAVARRIAQSTDDTSRSRQRLPHETASVYYGDSKITGDCGSELRFHLGRVKAREFYLGELGWYAATFDAVDWEARDRATSKKPEMFRQWLCKQCSGFCATGKNMGRWFGSDATCCPNCLAEDEDHSHLMHCTDPGRFALFREGVKALSEWMAKGHTHPDLEKMAPTVPA
jgi:hypothetical protein